MRKLKARTVVFAIYCCVLAFPLRGSSDELTVSYSSENLSMAERYGERLDALEAKFETQPTSMTCCCPGWFADIDYLNWKPRQAGLGIAVLDPVGAGVPSGGQPIQSLDFGRNSGLRVGIGRRTIADWDVGLKYTYFESDDSLAFAPGNGQVLAMLSSPATGLTNADSVSAAANLRLNIVDLEVGRWFRLAECATARASVGLRYASLDEELRVRYDGAAFTDAVVEAPADFRGFGGRIGGEIHWNLTTRFSIFGQLGVALLAGEIQSSRREENAGTVVIDVTDEVDQVVPVVDMSVGAEWQRGPVGLSAGYELSNWFNVAGRTDFADSFNGGSIDDGGTDLGFDGFFVRLAYTH